MGCDCDCSFYVTGFTILAVILILIFIWVIMIIVLYECWRPQSLILDEIDGIEVSGEVSESYSGFVKSHGLRLWLSVFFFGFIVLAVIFILTWTRSAIVMLLKLCSKFRRGSSLGQTTIASSEFNENVAEAKIADGSTISWCFDRQMYHLKAQCLVLVAVGRGRTRREQSECQICKSQPEPAITVTSGGSKFHCRDCRAVGRCKTLELTQCQIYFEKPLGMTDWIR